MSFIRNVIQTEHAPAAVGTYSQGIVFNNFYFYSGQIGLDPQTMQLKDGLTEQLNQIMNNIDALLEASDLTRNHIIKTSIFLIDLNDFSEVNKVYENFFTEPYPARSCVQVSALPKGALVEIEVVAAKEENA